MDKKTCRRALSLMMSLLLCVTSINFSIIANAAEIDGGDVAEAIVSETLEDTAEPVEEVEKADLPEGEEAQAEDETEEVSEEPDDTSGEESDEGIDDTLEDVNADAPEKLPEEEPDEELSALAGVFEDVAELTNVDEELEEEELEEELKEDEEEEEDVAFEESKVIDGVRVLVKADEGVFPEGATLSVAKVSGSEEQAVEAAVDAERASNKNVVESYTFDIKVLDADGNEIEPDTSKGTVKVSFTLEEVANGNLEADVYHVKGEVGSLSVDELNTVEVGETTVEAETDGFSYYVIVFSYDNLEYRFPSLDRIRILQILQRMMPLDSEKSITSAVSSNTSCFTVVNDNGEWYVVPGEFFTSTETLTVTYGGVDYVITVTVDVKDLSTATIKGLSKYYPVGTNASKIAGYINVLVGDERLYDGYATEVTDKNGESVDSLSEEGEYTLKIKPSESGYIGCVGEKTVKINAINTISGFTYTRASEEGSIAAEPASNLVDGNASNKWCSSYVPTWIEFKTSDNSLITPAGYIFVTGNDTSSESGRNPKNWVLKAKKNSEDAWTTIDTKTDNTEMPASNYAPYYFEFENTNSYQYFRLEINAIQYGSTFQLSEFYFIEKEPDYAAEVDGTKYLNWDDAVTAWKSESGSTLKLLSDAKVSSTIELTGSEKVLDLNGHGLIYTGPTGTTDRFKSVLRSETDLEIKDSSPDVEHKYTITAYSDKSNGAGLATVNDNATGENVKTFTGGYITGGKGYLFSGVPYGGAIYADKN